MLCFGSVKIVDGFPFMIAQITFKFNDGAET